MPTLFSSDSIVMRIVPFVPMASTAFLHRFSITHSNNSTFSGRKISSLSVMLVSRWIVDGMRVFRYDIVVRMQPMSSLSCSLGLLPIFEKRAAIFSSRFTSFSTSRNISVSPCSSRIISSQAISDDIGVPSWWAVSFDIPSQTWFCSDRRETFRTM